MNKLSQSSDDGCSDALRYPQQWGSRPTTTHDPRPKSLPTKVNNYPLPRSLPKITTRYPDRYPKLLPATQIATQHYYPLPGNGVRESLSLLT